MTETGYEDREDEAPETKVSYRMEKVEEIYSASSHVGRILRNGQAIGMIRFPSEAELEWMKERIAGDFDEEIEEMMKDGG